MSAWHLFEYRAKIDPITIIKYYDMVPCVVQVFDNTVQGLRILC
jgi:hypothetical protein